MQKINFKKLNNNYQPDPNIASPDVELAGDKLLLSFPLNYHLYDRYKEDQYGTIIFNDCFMYRVGDPNDEGFFIDPKNPGRMRNNSRWNITDFPQLEFHNFYLVENSDWQTNFGPDPIITKAVQSEIKDPEKLNHYLFLMKEGSFECIARSYEEKI